MLTPALLVVLFGNGFEAEGLFADAPADHPFEADKCPAADEKNVGRIDRREFLVRMLASALRGNVRDRAFENLQQRLLHAFAGDVAGDRRVLVLAADLVDLVDVDDAGLRARYVAVGGLQQLEDDVLDVLADVASFSERGRVDDGEGHIEHLGQSMRKQRLAAAGGADQQDVRLRQLYIVAARPVHLDALVVVVDRDGELLLGLLLADHIFVEKGLYFKRLGKMRRRCAGLRFAAIVFEDGIADGDAFVADIRARVVAGRRNELWPRRPATYGRTSIVVCRPIPCAFSCCCSFAMPQ